MKKKVIKTASDDAKKDLQIEIDDASTRIREFQQTIGEEKRAL